MAVAANLLGSWIAYGVGYFGRIELIERHGKWLHIKPSHLEWADRWFAKYGDAAVFFSRMLPIIRTFISLPAGVARMPFWRFTVLTVLGCIPWMVALTLRRQAGRRQLGGHRRATCTTSTTWSSPLIIVGAIVPGRALASRPGRRGRCPRDLIAASRRRCRRATRWRSGCCTARPSCCRSPPPAHTTLVPWLLGWPYPELDGELRKAFEVALHAGTAVGLLIALRGEVAEAAHGLDRAARHPARRVVPAAGRRRPAASSGRSRSASGRPGTIAAGLAAGAVAMVVADALGAAARTPRGREPRSTRSRSASRRRAR